MTLDDLEFLGGLVDPLEYDAYEIDNSLKSAKSEDLNKSKGRENGSARIWIKIKKPGLVALIVEAYVDQDKKKILHSLSDTAKTIPQILEMFSFEPTYGYRIIHDLIKSGLVKHYGYAIGENRKKIKNFVAVIEDLKIQIGKDIESVSVLFRKFNNASQSLK